MPSELQVRIRELGIKKVFNGYPPRLLTAYGLLNVNANAHRQLGRWLNGGIMENWARAREDLYAWIRAWNGGVWLYRVATGAYVDFDPSSILEYVRGLIPSMEPIRAGGLYGRGVYMAEGAIYAEGVWGLGEGDGLIRGLWVRTGDDGYTAIRVRPFYLFKQEISAVILPNRVSRRLHVGPETIKERVRLDVDASIAMLKTFELEKLGEYPVPFTVINYLARRVYDLPHHWRLIAPKYGENALALAITLGRCLTRASNERRERIARLLVLLTSDPGAFIEAHSQVDTSPRTRGLEESLA